MSLHADMSVMVSCSGSDIAAIREVAGDDLRVIAGYDQEGYDIQFVREDVEAKLPAVAEEIHEELVIQGIGQDYLEDLFQAGPLHCSVHRFEEVTAFHFLDEAYTGLFVSIDSDADLPFASFADRCRSILEDGTERSA